VSVRPGTLTVTKAPTITTIASTVAPGTSVPVSLTATVASTTTGTPTGVAVFHDGTQQIGSVALIEGVATLSTGVLTAGDHVLSVSYGGDTNYLVSSSTALPKVFIPPFLITVTPTPVNVAARQTAHLTVKVTPAAGFSGSVALTCSDLHQYDSTCKLAASSLNFSSGNTQPQTTTMDVTTAPTKVAALNSPVTEQGQPMLPALSFWIPGLVVGGFGLGKRKNMKSKHLFFALVVLLGLAGGLAGCGSGRPQEAGAFSVSVVGQSGSGAQAYTQTLPITIVIK
jgi:hypothetical protein